MMLALFRLSASDFGTFSSQCLWCWHFFVSATLILTHLHLHLQAQGYWHFFVSSPLMLTLLHLYLQAELLRLFSWHIYTFISRPKVFTLVRLSIFDLTLLHLHLQAQGTDTVSSERLWYWHFFTFICRPKYWHFFVSEPLILILLHLHLHAGLGIGTFSAP
jgi:hypothetical protein